MLSAAGSRQKSYSHFPKCVSVKLMIMHLHNQYQCCCFLAHEEETVHLRKHKVQVREEKEETIPLLKMWFDFVVLKFIIGINVNKTPVVENSCSLLKILQGVFAIQ